MAIQSPTLLKLRVGEALAKDVGRAMARMDPSNMQALGLQVGDVVEIQGKRVALARAMLSPKQQRGSGLIQIDGITRDNAGVSIDQTVQVRAAEVQPAERLTLTPLTSAARPADVEHIARLMDGLPVRDRDRVRIALFGQRAADFRVGNTRPSGSVVIDPGTVLEIAERAEPQERTISWEDIGGLRPQVQRIREIVELPLRYPEVFERLGIDAPAGVLLYGPPGSGKTLIARALAHESSASFCWISGPEIIHKFYGESEAHLREVFEKASQTAPSIIFLDEIDAIAPRREDVVGEVEKRVVAQLLSLMDGLRQRRNVVVIGATNIPNVLDVALRRPGRFDREISIPIPDRNGRREILEIHSRGMPLSADVDLDVLAGSTHGFTGADVEALCREAAMSCLRRLMPQIDFASELIPTEILMQLEVRMDDFREAFKQVEPSAIREVFAEVPDVAWSDVGGLESIKKRLSQAVEWPLRHERLLERAGVVAAKGILLTGPPGCGKTLLAKALANESQVNFISIKGPELLSKFVGESERAVRDIFRKARQASPCILFFDEMDALVPHRTLGLSDARVTERVISQFLAELDGVEELRGVLVLAATNRPDIIDPALLRPGRFDLILEVPPPDAAGRRQIFDIALKGKPLAAGIDRQRLVEKTDGLTGADIQSACRQAAWRAVSLAIEATSRKPQMDEDRVKLQIDMEMLEAAIQEQTERSLGRKPT